MSSVKDLKDDTDMDPLFWVQSLFESLNVSDEGKDSISCVIKVKFLSNHSNIEAKVGDITFGQFFERYRDDHDMMVSRFSLRLKENVINICYHLNDKVSKYVVNGTVTIFSTMFVPKTTMLKTALYHWDQKKPWPPCDNYSQEEPLNMLKFGDCGDQDHTCPRCAKGQYHPKHDNSDENMVVMLYPNSKARTGYNKYMLLEWISQQLGEGKVPTEPNTRIAFTADNVRAILNGTNYTEIQLNN